MPAKRLPKDKRREQLLDTALDIVRKDGTDALTLGYLAERAGVSKPIAYTHFATRSGLLIALYERQDQLQLQGLQEALEKAPRRLDDIARLIAEAYADCYVKAGPEFLAVTAALKGDSGMEAVHRAVLDRYVALYARILAPYANVGGTMLRQLCVAINGAGEALMRELLAGRSSASTAVAALTTVIVALAAAPKPIRLPRAPR